MSYIHDRGWGASLLLAGMVVSAGAIFSDSPEKLIPVVISLSGAGAALYIGSYLSERTELHRQQYTNSHLEDKVGE